MGSCGNSATKSHLITNPFKTVPKNKNVSVELPRNYSIDIDIPRVPLVFSLGSIYLGK